MKRKTWICSLLAAAVAAPAFSLDWVTDFDAAKAQAAKEGKAVLVDFTGSDWCGFCIKLKKEVFDSPEFDAYAKDKFVCLEIDLPQGNKISAEQKKINEELSELYNVDGFPSIFVMTPQGYVVGGFCGFRALPEVQKALDTGLANAKAIADAEKQGNDAKVDAMFKVWKGLGDELAGSAQQLRSDLVKLDVNDRCGLRTQKQAEEEIRDVQKQLQDCVQEAGSKGLKDALALLESKQGSLMEQNRHAAIQIKTSLMFMLCETQEDLNRMRDTLVAELKALDPAKYDAEQIEQDIQRITQIAKDGQQALDYAKDSRESMDERAEAAKAAEREAAEEAKLQSEGATKLEWGTDLAAAKEQAAKENKPILLLFTGSDWCGACIALHKEVFDKVRFAAYARDKFIPVEIDCPHGNKMSEEQKKANNDLAEKMHVEGFPSVLVLTPQGTVAGGFVGSQDFAGVQEDLDIALKNVKTITDAGKMEPEARAKALAELYRSLDEDVIPMAAGLEAEIVKLDPEDKTGLRRDLERQAKYDQLVEHTMSILKQGDSKKAIPEIIAYCDKELATATDDDFKLALIEAKTTFLFVGAQTKEDIAKMRETLASDLQKVDQSKADAKHYADVKGGPASFETDEEGLEIAKKYREAIEQLDKIERE